jgi:uridine phosphorylase
MRAIASRLRRSRCCAIERGCETSGGWVFFHEVEKGSEGGIIKMTNMAFEPSELILNQDGSVYHLSLLPHQIADTILLVGDPDRVAKVSRHFDKIDHRTQKREFTTHTGFYKGLRLSVLSTGIATDNIDIAVNELDALANIDLVNRELLGEHRSLNLIRIGTSGGLREDIAPGSLVASAGAIGMDGLAAYYRLPDHPPAVQLLSDFTSFCREKGAALPVPPYAGTADATLLDLLAPGLETGITLTAAGFYAPQTRKLRLDVWDPDFLEKLNRFESGKYCLTNMEMETAGIYALGRALGHKALSINAIIGNRVTRQFAADPALVVENMITTMLDRLVENRDALGY